MGETHGSETTATRPRRRKRNPLADLTNSTTAASASASSVLKPCPLDPNSARRATRTTTNGPEHREAEATPSATPRVKEIDDSSVGNDAILTREEVKHSVLDTGGSKTRKKVKGKGIAVSVATSCPPIGRTRSPNRGNLNMEDLKVYPPKEFSVPYRNIDKKRRYTMPPSILEPMLPRDFVETQRAYFADVDAFELPEEVASESDSK